MKVSNMEEIKKTLFGEWIKIGLNFNRKIGFFTAKTYTSNTRC